MIVDEMPAPTVRSDADGTILEFGNQGDHFRFAASSPAGCLWLKDRCAAGFHEPVMSALVIDFMGRLPGSTFLDIGAYFGYFGLLALAASRGAGKVYAFEMNPLSYAAMERNFAANAHLNSDRPDSGFIEGVHAALGNADQAGRATSFKGFHFDTADLGLKRANIDFVKLDTFVRDRGMQADLIKIDVEGYEAQVLLGGMDMIQRDQPTILLELHNNAMLSRHGTTRVALLEKLAGEGLRIFHLGHQRRGNTTRIVELTGDILVQRRDELEAQGDELVAICHRDIRDVWPALRNA